MLWWKELRGWGKLEICPLSLPISTPSHSLRLHPTFLETSVGSAWTWVLPDHEMCRETLWEALERHLPGRICSGPQKRSHNHS